MEEKKYFIHPFQNAFSVQLNLQGNYYFQRDIGEMEKVKIRSPTHGNHNKHPFELFSAS